jgi:ABC-2 type transport system permease protein
LATALISLLQVYAFLAIAWVYGVRPPAMGLLWALPALLVALMLSALGLLLSNAIRQLENFAGVMNFVIFPLFFLSSALYPLWKMRESSEWLYWLCALNPFTHAVELVRFALYERFNALALAVCVGLTLLFSLLAVLTFNPQHAALRKSG